MPEETKNERQSKDISNKAKETSGRSDKKVEGFSRDKSYNTKGVGSKDDSGQAASKESSNKSEDISNKSDRRGDNDSHGKPRYRDSRSGFSEDRNTRDSSRSNHNSGWRHGDRTRENYNKRTDNRRDTSSSSSSRISSDHRRNNSYHNRNTFRNTQPQYRYNNNNINNISSYYRNNQNGAVFYPQTSLTLLQSLATLFPTIFNAGGISNNHQNTRINNGGREGYRSNRQKASDNSRKAELKGSEGSENVKSCENVSGKESEEAVRNKPCTISSNNDESIEGNKEESGNKASVSASTSEVGIPSVEDGGNKEAVLVDDGGNKKAVIVDDGGNKEVVLVNDGGNREDVLECRTDTNSTTLNEQPETNTPVETIQETAPRISLVPLSLLLKDGVLLEDFGVGDDSNAIAVTDKSQIPQDPDALSRKILNKIVKMDKIGIKNVINNENPKFDAALRVCARKRLREEIRKQLKQLNFEAPLDIDGQNNDGDDYIDAEQFPAVISDELRRALGVDFFQNIEMSIPPQPPNNDSSTVQVTEDKTGLGEVVQVSNIEQNITTTQDLNIVENVSSQPPIDNPKTDLMTRLKNFENLKSQLEKSPRRPSKKSSSTSPVKSKDPEVVSINSSSDTSSDSSTSSSDSDSDSSSTSSSSTDDVAATMKKLKKNRHALEENVVNSFKKLILPSLQPSQQRCFEQKLEKGLQNCLLYIYDICISKMKKKSTIGPYESRALKKNLKSTYNNKGALDFLMTNIKELFEQNKSTSNKKQSKNVDINKNNAKTTKNSKRKVLNVKIISTDNRKISNISTPNEISPVSPLKDNDPPDNDKTQSSEYINKGKVSTEEVEKTAKSAAAFDDGDGNRISPNITEVEEIPANTNTYLGGCGNNIPPSGSSLQTEVTFTEDCNKSIESTLGESNASPRSIKSGPSELNEIMTTPSKNLEYSPMGNESDLRPRAWKSPGEKKCLPTLTEFNNYSKERDVNEVLTSPTRSNQLHQTSPTSFTSPTTSAYNTAAELELLTKIQEHKISDVVLNSLKEIELKLMELHKRKIYVEEMILKLQKDKMDIDVATMQLQNEKFLIINTAAAKSNLAISSVTSLYGQDELRLSTTLPSSSELLQEQHASTTAIPTSPTSTTCCNRKRKLAEIRKPFSTPFSEKLRNRKKRCQRDILLEDTANTLENHNEHLTNIIRNSSPEKISENVDSIFQKSSRNSKTPGKYKKNAPKRKYNKKKVTTKQPKTACDKRNDKNNIQSTNNTNSIMGKNHLEHFDDHTNKDCVDNNDDIVSSYEEEESLDAFCNSDVPNGYFKGTKMPVTNIKVVSEFIIAASEDGVIYKYSWRTKELLAKFSKHREAVTQIFIDPNKFIYSTSLDGYLKKTSVEDFGLEIQSVSIQEPLQSVDLQWDTAFIGSRWGNVFKYDLKTNKLSETLLCSVGSSIMALKATTEGPRQILIVSSKGNQINIRDATSGVLLRTIAVPSDFNIYSILLDGNILYCGSSKNEIYTYDFTTGNRLNLFLCGSGAVTMKLFKDKLIFVGCCDGFVYVLNKTNGCQIGRFPGCGRSILAADIVGEKLITSSKDGKMQLMDIPNYILALV